MSVTFSSLTFSWRDFRPETWIQIGPWICSFPATMNLSKLIKDSAAPFLYVPWNLGVKVLCGIKLQGLLAWVSKLPWINLSAEVFLSTWSALPTDTTIFLQKSNEIGLAFSCPQKSLSLFLKHVENMELTQGGIKLKILTITVFFYTDCEAVACTKNLKGRSKRHKKYTLAHVLEPKRAHLHALWLPEE